MEKNKLGEEGKGEEYGIVGGIEEIANRFSRA